LGADAGRGGGFDPGASLAGRPASTQYVAADPVTTSKQNEAKLKPGMIRNSWFIFISSGLFAR
jgi:hypothetical protein